MIATLLTKTTFAVIVLLLLVILLGRRIWQLKTPLGLFFLVYYADNLLIILPNAYPAVRVIPNHVWEGFLVCSWSGKLYSILFVLATLYLTRSLLPFKEAGLTIRQEPGSFLPCALVVLALAAWATWIGIRSPKGLFDGEILLYLAIMPGINEELVYRGYLQGMLNRLLPRRVNLLGAGIGWGAILVTLLFGLLHGFWFDNSLGAHFDLIALENSLMSGFVFAWLRERSGSLVMPVIAHGLEDFLFFLPRMV